MKKIILGLIFFVFCACAPKIRSTITTKLPPLSDNALVVVLDMVDDKQLPKDKVGEISAKDSGLSQNCTYYENIESLKQLARKAGANLVKIKQHKQPDNWSTCHRIVADIYKAEDVKAYESEIYWSPDRKLTWADFKGEPDLEVFPNALAVTNSGIGYEGGANFLKGGKLFIRSVFNNYGSWVLAKGKTDYVLRHEQIHFDITEIYSRKLRKAFADANITSADGERAKQIFDKIVEELRIEQEQYDDETQRGSKKDIQEKWEAVVVIELAKYDLYKSN